MASFHQLVNSLDSPVFYFDTKLNIRYVNHAFILLCDYTNEECAGLSINNIFSLPNGKPLKEFPDNAPSNISLEITKKNGAKGLVDVSIFIEKSEGQTSGYSAYIAEKTIQQKNSQNQLSKSDLIKIDDKYKTLYNLTFEGLIIHDKGIILDANPAFVHMTGYSREEIIGCNVIELCILPDDRQQVIEAMKNEVTSPYLILTQRKDGAVIHTEVESRRIHYDGKVVRVTTIRDITSREVAEKALKDSEERYKLLSNITFEGIFLHDKGVVKDANQSLSNMIGYEIDEIIGQNIIQLVVLPEYHQRVATALKNEETTPYIVKVKRKNGSIFFAEVQAGMVKYKGKLLRVTAARDVSWRIEAERKLRENQEELDTFFSQSGDGFFIMKLNSPINWNPEKNNEEQLDFVMANMRLTKINDAMIWQYNAKDDKIKDFALEQFFAWNNVFGKNFTREMLDKGFIKFEMAEPKFDDTIMWVEGNYLVLYDEAGKVRGCCGVRREISERKKTEEKIKKHNEELQKANQELDNFVYRVSHDLKAPISSVKGLIHIAQLETEHKRIDTCLGLIQNSMDKLDSFILDILDYSKNARLAIEPALIDFDILIKDTLLQTKYLQYESNLEIETEINDKIAFYSDRQRLVFIFNNLLSNAIRFTDENKQNSFLKIKIEINQQQALIIFIDNGIGIKQEYLDRIFDMFYRAHEDRVGSGLGLYIVRESMEKLNGTIHVESVIDKGTKFELSLPNLLKT